MKIPMFFLTVGFCLALAAKTWSQGAEDRVTLQFSDPSKPGLLKADLMNGSITVKGYQGKEIVIEAKARGKRYSKKEERESGGMQRIAISSTGLSVEEENNEVSVEAESHMRTIDLTIQVPIKTSLKLSTINSGDVFVENIDGEVEVDNTNGDIEAQNVSGVVVANTTNGKVVVNFKSITPDKPMSFVSFNGNVDVTFPANLKADVKMKSEQGEIYSDFEIKLEERSRIVQEDSRNRGGKYRVKVESTIFGAINGGGPEYHFSTYNGDIYIRRQK